MNAQLVTLEGENFSMSPYIMGNEQMGGLLDFFKSAGTAITSSFVSPIKGFTHFIMEAGRGIAAGDWGRVGASPFKGIGHTGMDFFRKNTEYAEWYYRPSKMRQWMSPIGAAFMAAGAVFPPLLIPGAALTAGGAIGEGLYQKDRATKADKAEKERLVAAKKSNLMWTLAAVGLLGAGAYMAFK